MKKHFIVFGLMLSLFASGLAFAAQEYAQSDIDEDESTIEISFVKATNPSGANFSCKYTENNGTVTNFNENTDYTFTETGWDSSTEKFTKLADCFHSAGDYTLDIHLVDKAGNTNDETKSFTVVASTPESVYTELNEDKSTAFADNSDEITLTLVLKDAHGNEVSGQSPKIHSSTGEFSDDANVGVKFRGGLKVNADGSYQYLPSVFGSAIAVTNPNSIKLKALAPSIQKVGTGVTELNKMGLNGYGWLSKVISRGIKFVITNLKEVDSDGNITNNNADDVEITKYLTFKNPFFAEPRVEGDIEIEGDVVAKIKLAKQGTGTNTTTINFPSTNSSLTSYDLLGNLCVNNDDGSNTITTCTTSETKNNVNLNNNLDMFAPTRFLNETGSSVVGTGSIALATLLSYQISENGNNYNISYPAGAVGGIFAENTFNASSPEYIIGLNTDDISAKFIGADIEGFTAVDKDKAVLGTTNKQILNIGLNSNKTDIYEEIVKNGFELARNSANKFADNSKNLDELFANGNEVAVVDLSSANNNAEKVLTISSSDDKLPSGRKTLVLINGNLKIASNLEYTNPKTDSFGVIVLRTKAGKEPAVGNIFVKSDVKKIAGSYFADGGFMNNDGNTIATGNKPESHYQLLLEGALLSRNTLGGSLRGKNSNGTAPDYTPWENDASNDVARRYDLHYVRRYDSSLSGDGTNIGLGGSETNTAAFIIRPDQKVNVLPPPGFKIQ